MPSSANSPHSPSRKNPMKQLALALSLSCCTLGALAGIVDNGPGVKKFFDDNPSVVQAAIRMTDVNTWGRCANVHLSTMAMELRGQQWDKTTALIFAGLGEAMGRVRGALLRQGYSQSALDATLRSYSGRPVDVPDMQFCSDLTNRILEARQAAAPAQAPAPAPAQAPAPASNDAAFAPSFDCAKASTAQEKMICADRELSRLDVELSQAYSRARSQRADKDGLRKEQTQWLRTNVRACTDKPCLADTYKKRITELQ